MPIRVTCPCRSSYTAKDELAGKRFKCRKCGADLEVPRPGAAAPASEAEPDDSETYSFSSADSGSEPDDVAEEHEPPPRLPPKVSSRPRTKKRAASEPASGRSGASPASPSASMSLEERIAARAAEAEQEQKGWKGKLSNLNQGGGYLIGLLFVFALGIAFLVGAFVMPAVFHERYADPSWTPEGNGDAFLYSIHKNFGRVGVGITLAAFGCAILYGGYRGIRRWGSWQEDD